VDYYDIDLALLLYSSLYNIISISKQFILKQKILKLLCLNMYYTWISIVWNWNIIVLVFIIVVIQEKIIKILLFLHKSLLWYIDKLLKYCYFYQLLLLCFKNKLLKDNCFNIYYCFIIRNNYYCCNLTTICWNYTFSTHIILALK
jgi:hypothetical protein